jgi:hypothetical protein
MSNQFQSYRENVRLTKMECLSTTTTSTASTSATSKEWIRATKELREDVLSITRGVPE